jgi:transglutaminase-like putative cysteine protease
VVGLVSRGLLNTGGILPQLEKPIDLSLKNNKEELIALGVYLVIALMLLSPVSFAYEASQSLPPATTMPRTDPFEPAPFDYNGSMPLNFSAGDLGGSINTGSAPLRTFSGSDPKTYNETVLYFSSSLQAYQEAVYVMYSATRNLTSSLNLSMLDSEYLSYGLNDPRGIAMVSANGTDYLYVSDYYGKNNSGNAYGSISKISVYGAEHAYIEFAAQENPLGITEKNGTLYYLSRTGKVMKIAPDLKTQPEKAFDLPVQVTDPVGIAYDKDREIFWVLGISSQKIFGIYPNGTVKSNYSIGALDPSSGYISYQKDRIYVSDKDAVSVYDLNGTLQETVSLAGMFKDQMNISAVQIKGIALEENSNYYVVDSLSRSFYEFGYGDILAADSGAVADAVTGLETGYHALSASLNLLEKSINELSVPAAGAQKYALGKQRFGNAKDKLKNAAKALLNSSTHVSDAINQVNSSTYRKDRYPQLISQIKDLRNDLQTVVDVIYNESSIPGAVEPDYVLLSHRMNALNYTAAPLIGVNVSSAAPLAEDLLETPDVKFSSEIQTKAAALSVPELYGWVKEAFSYEPYYGSLKGTDIAMRTRDDAQSDLIEITRFPNTEDDTTYMVDGQNGYTFKYTLKQRSANDADQATVLIALLRSKGISSRYVHGTIEAPLKDVAAFLGVKNSSGVTDYPEGDSYYVMKTLRDAGVPAKLAGGNIRLEHWWVTAYINSGWTDLDPSWKFDPGIPVINKPYTESDASGYSSESMNFSLSLVKTFGNMTQYDISKVFNESKEYIDADLSSYTILPISPGYKVLSRFAEYSSLPEAARNYADIEILDGNASLLNYTAPVYDLANAPVSVRFAETSETRDIISQMGATDASFLKNHTPAIYYNESLVANTGKSKISGEAYTLKLTLRNGLANRTIKAALQSGKDTAIVYDVGGVSRYYFEETLRRTNESAQLNSTTDQQKTILALNMLGVAYFDAVDGGYEDSAIRNLQTFRKTSPSVAITSAGSEIFFGTPLLSTDSMSLDVVEDIFYIAPRNEQADPEPSAAFYNLQTSYNNAFVETALLGTMEESGENIRTVSAYMIDTLARKQNIEPYSLSSGNYDEMLQDVLLPSRVTAGIRKAALSGKIVSGASQPVYVNSQACYNMIISDGNLGASYVLISQGRYSYGSGIAGLISNFLQKVKTTIEDWGFKFMKILNSIWDFLDAVRAAFEWRKMYATLKPWADETLKFLEHYKGMVTTYVDKVTKVLGIIGIVFDVFDLINYVTYCLVDLGSLQCVVTWTMYKVLGAIVTIVGTAAIALTAGLSEAAVIVIKLLADIIIEGVLAAGCNPSFYGVGSVKSYKKYNDQNSADNKKSDGLKEGPGDREYYAGDVDKCYKEVIFGTDKKVIVNTGLFPMLDANYTVKTIVGKTEQERLRETIPFLPGPQSPPLFPVDWLDGTTFSYPFKGPVPAADGKEDTKPIQIEQTTKFKFEAEDSGKCRIEYKVLGVIRPSWFHARLSYMDQAAKTPIGDNYKGTTAELIYDKEECCKAVVDPADYKRCLNTIRMDSTIANGAKTDAFTIKDDIYVKVQYDTKEEVKGFMYVMKSGDLTMGGKLEDISPDGEIGPARRHF